jgi:putative membrane protein
MMLGGVFVIVCVAMMIWMMSGHGMMGHGNHGHSDAANARDILAERFARGELSEEEFEQRKRVLEGYPPS